MSFELTREVAPNLLFEQQRAHLINSLTPIIKVIPQDQLTAVILYSSAVSSGMDKREPLDSPAIKRKTDWKGNMNTTYTGQVDPMSSDLDVAIITKENFDFDKFIDNMSADWKDHYKYGTEPVFEGTHRIIKHHDLTHRSIESWFWPENIFLDNVDSNEVAKYIALTGQVIYTPNEQTCQELQLAVNKKLNPGDHKSGYLYFDKEWSGDFNQKMAENTPQPVTTPNLKTEP